MFEKDMILKWLILINLILVVFYLILNHIFVVPSSTIRHLFDLNAEANIPTWFSSTQLFSLFVLCVIYSREIEDKNLRNFYILMGLMFLFFSVDETSMIHEGISTAFKKLSIQSVFPDAHGMWILVYPVILTILGSMYWKGLLAFLNEKKGRAIFIIGAVLFVIGGVVFEVVGYYLPTEQGEESIFNIIEITAEESFELLGQSLMVYSLLTKLYSSVTIQIIIEESA